MSRLAGVVVERKRISRGKVLYEEGSAFTHLFVLASGSSKSVAQCNDGTCRIANLALRGDLVGFSGASSGTYTETQVALENSIFCVMPYTHLMQCILQDRTIGFQFHRLIARVMLQRQEASLLTASSSAERQIGGFLIWLSDQLAQRKQHPTEFSLPLSRGDLAEFIGLRLETVSRTFSRLDKLQLVTTNGRHIRILDLQVLRNWHSALP